MNRRVAGFTVMEVLVAASLMTLLVGVVLGIATGVLGAWNRSTDRLSRTGAARLALDALAQDLRALHAPEFGQDATQDLAWMRLSATAASDELRFFAWMTEGAADGAGDVAAVAYWVEARDHVQSGFASTNLYRAVQAPEETFVAFLAEVGGLDPQRWPAPRHYLGAQNAAAFNAALLLTDVVDLQVDVLVANAAGEAVRLQVADDPLDFPLTPAVDGTPFPAARPRGFVLTLRYHSHQTSARLRAGQLRAEEAAAWAQSVSQTVWLP